MNENDKFPCTICKQKYTRNLFDGDKSRKSGISPTCKGCKKNQRENRKKVSKIVESRKCNACKIVKLAKYFDKKKESLNGLHTECKECGKKKRDIIKGVDKCLPEDYSQECNKCGIVKHKTEYYSNVYSNNGICKICVLCTKDQQKEWREANPNKIKMYRSTEYYKNYKRRRIENPESVLAGNIRNRIRNALKRGQTLKQDTSTNLIDCTFDEYRNWLGYQFDSNMSWSNYGSYWTVDHVVPCASFDLNNVENQKECFNWRNCRPLKASRNSSKSDNIIPFEIMLQELKVHYYEQHAQIAGIS
jgi:hypothetical protein